VLLTLSRLVMGRTLTVRRPDGDITMKVAEFESRLDVFRLAVGRLDDIRLTVSDISWETTGFERATVRLRNVQLLPGAPPVVVAAPVEVSLDVPTSALEHLLLAAAPKVGGQIGPDGVARMHWARRPAMGHVEVDAELDGEVLRLKPRAVTVGRRRWALPARTPARRVRLPLLPHGLTLTKVEFEPGLLRISGTMPQWRLPVSRRRLEDLLDAIVGQLLRY
jgi:LmeA-like phospholipid-binding